jgi:hypothetical protein
MQWPQALLLFGYMPPTLNPPSTMSKLFDLFGRLFSDAKTAENLAQKFVRRQMTGDFPQGILGCAKVFSQQLSGPVTLKLALPLNQKIPGALQCVQMPAAGKKAAFGGGDKAHALLEMIPKQVDTFRPFCGNA